jgi:hypothetical protein
MAVYLFEINSTIFTNRDRYPTAAFIVKIPASPKLTFNSFRPPLFALLAGVSGKGQY